MRSRIWLRPWSHRVARADESGQLIPLIIGFGIIIILLCSVVVDAAQAFTYRRALNAVADGAVLAATNGIDKEAIYRYGVKDRVVISTSLANAEVQEYVANGGYESVSCGAVVNAVLTEVTVTCDGTATLPIANSITGGRATVPIRVESSAETFARP